jgi:hypothetical protein
MYCKTAKYHIISVAKSYDFFIAISENLCKMHISHSPKTRLSFFEFESSAKMTAAKRIECDISEENFQISDFFSKFLIKQKLILSGLFVQLRTNYVKGNNYQKLLY